MKDQFTKRFCTKKSPISPSSYLRTQVAPLSLASTTSPFPLPECTPLEYAHSECSSDTQSSLDSGISTTASNRSPFMPPPGLCSEVQVTVDVTLSTQLQILKSEVGKLKFAREAKRAPFRVECISHDDSLVSLYTGFPSYDVLLSFYKFLEPAVSTLTYWGTKRKTLAR